MTTRYYKSWDTLETGYVPKSRSYSYHHQISRPSYNRTTVPYPRSYTGHSYTSSYTSSYSPSYSYPGSSFDYVSGRLNNSGTSSSRLGEFNRSEQLHRHLDNLSASTQRLLRSSATAYEERDSYIGLPVGYGAPKYLGSERPKAAVRYGMNYGRVRLDSRGNCSYGNVVVDDEPLTRYERNKLEDYQGSLGSVLYQKEMHKGQFDVHDQGVREGKELDTPELRSPAVHESSSSTKPAEVTSIGEIISSSGLKKSASRGDIEILGAADDDDAVEKEDSGIADESEDDFDGEGIEVNVEEVPESEPEPEICVYNEITEEDFQEIQKAVEEEEIEKIVGTFVPETDDPGKPVGLSPIEGMNSCYVTSPLPSPKETGDGGQFSFEDGKAGEEPTEPVEVKLDLEEAADIQLDVSAEVVQVGEETIVTETVEEVVEEIKTEEEVPEEVHLTISEEKVEAAESATEVAAEPVADAAPEVEEKVEEPPVAEAPITEAPVAEEPVTEASVAEAPVAEEPATEALAAVEPVAEAPVAEEPKVEELTVEEPKVEELTVEEPKVEEKKDEAPKEEVGAANGPAAATEVAESKEAPPVEAPKEETKAPEPKSKFNRFEKKFGKAPEPEPKTSKFGQRKFGNLGSKFEGKAGGAARDRQLPPKKKLY